MKLANVTYEVHHPEVVDLNLTVKNQNFVDFNFEIVRGITQLFLDLDATFDFGVGYKNLAHLNRTIDLCIFLNSKKSSNPLVSITYGLWRFAKEVPHSEGRKNSVTLGLVHNFNILPHFAGIVQSSEHIHRSR